MDTDREKGHQKERKVAEEHRPVSLELREVLCYHCHLSSRYSSSVKKHANF